jgi:hypothetical protein
MSARVDVVERIRADLRAEDVVERYGLEALPRGSQLRLETCPRCGETSSRLGIAIDRETGQWVHHGHGKKAGGACSGDLIDLVAAIEGLDPKRDWQAVRDRCAAICGLDHELSTAEIEERQRRADDRRHRAEQEEALAAVARCRRAASEWRTFHGRHDEGADYLRRRGLDHRGLVQREIVRFTRDGAIAVRLFDFGGELASVPRRWRLPRDPKVKVWVPRGGTQRGTMIGRVVDIGPGDTMITEGLMDSVTAAQLWPERLILGAGGAELVATVAAHAAPRVRAVGGRLWVVPDSDVEGMRACAAAIDAAIAAGLTPGQDLIVLAFGAHHDLNAAHCAGWKP